MAGTGPDVDGRMLVVGCLHTATTAIQALDATTMASFIYTELPCLGALEGLELLRALDRGATRVLVVGCHEGRCRHVTGSRRAKAVVAHAQDVLAEAGLERARVGLVLASPLEPGEVVRAVHEFLRMANDGGSAP